MGDWRVFEFTIHDTELVGKRLRDTEIRKLSGANVIGVWERGCLIPADADTRLSPRMTRRGARVSLTIIAITIICTLSTQALADGIREGAVLDTFDPFGDDNTEIDTEEDALADLRPKLMTSLGYSYVYRTRFPGKNIVWAEENMHTLTMGVTYMPWHFLFVGAMSLWRKCS